jgi:hypothetical protein
VAERAGVTVRDLGVLAFAVEMFGLPLGLVAELVARDAPERLSPASAERVARRVAARLREGGYARLVRVAGEVWLVPTEAGLHLGMAEGQSTPYQVWRPAAWKLDHLAAVARLRLFLEDAYPGAVWQSERAIRRRWHSTGARVRLADGGLHLANGQAVGVEVELHVKRLNLYEGIVRDVDPAWTRGIWWWTPAANLELLYRRLEAAGAVGHEVYELPDGIGS